MKKSLFQLCVLVLCLFRGAGLVAGDKPAVARNSDAAKMRSGIVFETLAIDPEVYTRVEGGKKSVMVPVHEWDYGVKLFTAAEWKKRNYKKGEYRGLAEVVADKVLEKAQLEFIRDRRDVVLYAVVRSEDPFLSSILLSKKFLPKFKKNMGEIVRVVIVDRQELYVFPDSGGKLDEYGPVLAQRYKTTRQPVSLEIFQVSDKGLKIIGTIGR